ncbi:MAG: cell wall-binding repeat-containing protein, partial [Actinomycetota bacterium]|nr:cell wall-binding repeat-containing protein [Actinomycetota bacterium]
MRIRRLLSITLGASLLFALALPGLADAAGGVTWAERMIPGLEGEIRSVTWLSEDYGLTYDQGFVFEYNNANTLWTTENGGDTWSHNSIWPSGTALLFGDSFEIMDVDFALGGLKGWAVGVFKHAIVLPPFIEYSPVIFATTDGGATWTNKTGNLDTDLRGEGALNAVLWVGGSDVYACGENGMVVARTNLGDGPEVWKVVSHDIEGTDYNDVCQGYDFGVNRAVCVGDNSALAYYDQNQISHAWSNPYEPEVAAGGWNFQAVIWADTDTGRILAVGDHGLFAWSSDNGLSWDVDTTDNVDDIRWSGLGYAGVASSGAPPIAYAAGSQGQIREFSFNSGPGTWSDSDPGPTGLPATAHLRAISAHWDGHIWAGGVDGAFVERTPSTSTRAAGTDRYSTALAMSADWADGSCDTVVMATGLDFPDALSASALAGTYECPLLLTGSTLRSDVAAEIERLGATTIVIVGGYSAVPEAVEDALPDSVSTVERLAGDNRYHTSELVALKIAEEEGADFTHQAFIARGDGFADALAVSPFAYSQKIPVMLTNTNSLPGITQLALSNLNI